MNKMFRKTNIIKVKEKAQPTEDLVAIDAKMELLVNGKLLGKFYLSPEDLEDFTIGYLLDERYINALSDVKEIIINSDTIKVSLSENDNFKTDDLSCYDGWVHQDQPLSHVISDLKVEKDKIIDSYQLLIEKAEVWSKTGGTHVAALVSEDQFIVREDVSRHVAVDKVIGAGLKAGIDFSESFIVCSGRIPPDRVVKLANVGISIMVTKAAPTVEGLRIGEEAGITLIGFLRDGRFNIYTHPHRIIL
ncbi:MULTISPECIES: formate dehydrogenase accessory sulfurtransferase FdhD [Methanobacterium]|jgi:FdhD protein|uniref:Sulfur carrier protein FdhD n=1 Tax=Methanobacterium subterraneum TaxID=59277 RepID=A0A2H4VSG4_9EURY|nr:MULTISPECIES: formate dehydrogenase accessory sulfurtransferase FdhD [Methanobacterium]AUB57902.1 formate dehydrogenase family accessory protein FdhD [Methanobacterium sp. MZ-A1]AUB61038.1 formate dehydrogenase family accessory protein FdhD [Methanobacterium subterraneum]MBW4256492.1 formate dehydrogenase accessory sulfurtransferase FdhD [Methanobacterium sp. YSL]NMO10473.1 formate dehydrogenase accessory sulfurtransferase FdhD [Methanobacterium subterraneum]